MNVLTEIWYDLRARRLWPVAVVLLIALLAVPVFLLKPTSEASQPALTPEPETASLAIATGDGGPVEGSDLEIFNPRDPFKRVEDLSAKRGGGPDDRGPTSGGSDGSGAGSGGAPSTGGGSGGSGGSAPAPSDPGGSTGGSDPSPTPAPRPPAPPTTYTYTVDVRFGEGERPRLYRDVQRLTPLPSDRNPLIVFLGVSAGQSEAIFLIDSDLGQEGEGVCDPNKNDCTFLRLKVQDFQDDHLLYDPATDRNLRLKLVSINRVPVKRAAQQAAASRAEARRSSAASSDPRPFHSLLFGDETE